MEINMKFKKSLFLTFCLLFGTTAHPISWNDIKNKAHTATNTALIKLAELNPMRHPSYRRSDDAAPILAGSLLLGLAGAIFAAVAIEQGTRIGVIDLDENLQTTIIKTCAGIAALIPASVCGTAYCADNYLESKIETISEKIKNGTELSDNEVSLFTQALTTEDNSYNNRFNYYYPNNGKKGSTIDKPGYSGITPSTDNDQPNVVNVGPINSNSNSDPLDKLRNDEHLIDAINHPQLNSNSETIDAILEYVLNKKRKFSYECFRAFLPFVEQYGADYIKRNGLDTKIYGRDAKKALFSAECILCDRALAQYIKKYGTAQENSEILASLKQDFKFRPRTIKALSKKLGGVQDVFANLKEKFLSHIPYHCSADLFFYDELIDTFPEFKNGSKELLDILITSDYGW